jgi:hypothetical protein
VWMMVLPSRLWRKHEQYLKLKAERRSIPESMQDPRLDVADHMAGKFMEAGWEATYEKPHVMVDTRKAPGE